MHEPSIHPAALDEAALLGQCGRATGRGSGPGGQHRNKVETQVRLTHRPTGIIGQAGERRSQVQNQKMALRRLRLALAVGVRTTREAGQTPSALWRSRCSGGRIACNAEHDDYPAVLAEALDVLGMHEAGVPDAAGALGVSGSQLVKLIAKHPPALASVNADRAERGLAPLRG